MVGKKKRGHPDLEEILARPWCYYCERDFDDLKILISHQKAKHFKCERCSRRLNTAGGLSVHMNQVHKETLTSVDNALGNRASLDVEIFGMEGIPDDVKQAHNQRIIQQYYQAEENRRAASGNHGHGGQGGNNVSKKPKFESPAELKKRLAEHKARKAELAAAGGSSGGNTPGVGAPASLSPAPAQSPPFANSPYAPPQVPYGGPPNAAYPQYPPEQFGQCPPQGYSPQFQQPPYGGPGGQYPPPAAPYTAPPYVPQPSFSPGPYQQAPAFPGGPPHYGAGTPPNFSPYPPPPHPPGPFAGSLPPRPASLPQAPGLPSRPSFGAPPGGQLPMHPGQPPQAGWGGNQWNGPEHHNQAMSPAYPSHNQGYNDAHATNGSNAATREPDDIDALIRLAEAGIKPPKKDEPTAAQAPAPASVAETASAAPAQPNAPAQTQTQIPTAPETSEKKPKKEKEVPKMVFSDNETSPEEKMAQLSRYAFAPEKDDSTTVHETTQVPIVGNATVEE